MNTNLNDPFFQYGSWGSKTLMQLNGLSVTLHMPEALKSRFCGGEEYAQALPPYAPRAAFLVDDYPAAPPDWMRSEPGVASYMVPVAPEHGMWLDFNANARHEKHVAVIVSTQGINALTGQKTDKLRLEQYRERCPVHDVQFVGNRRCNKCKFEWPAQNYLATTTTPSGLFWLDGFRAADGVTRQWVFTEDVRRSVAAAVIGEERVHAIGAAFFLSKEAKPPRPVARFGGVRFNACAAASYGDTLVRYRSAAPVVAKKFEVAAGARIDQTVYADDRELSFWEEKPAGVIIINYTDAKSLLAILQQGSTENREGFLGASGVPLGHA